MSKLETGIAEWRARMIQALPQRNEALAELEEHLREHFASLQRQGASDEEAFLAAQQSIGEPNIIAREFNRLPDDWRPGLIMLRVSALIFAGLMVATIWRLWHLPNKAYQLTSIASFMVVYFVLFSHVLIATGAFLQTWRRPLTEREGRAVSRMLRRLAQLTAVVVPISCGITMWHLAPDYKEVPSFNYLRMAATLAAVALLIFTQSRPAASDRVRWLRAMFASLVVTFSSIRIYAIPVAWLSGVFLLGVVFLSLPRFRTRRERVRNSN